MNEDAKVRILSSELEKSRAVLARIVEFYDRYLDKTQDVRERTTEQAIVPLRDFYPRPPLSSASPL